MKELVEIELPIELAEKLEARAKAEGVTVSEFIKRQIKKHEAKKNP